MKRVKYAHIMKHPFLFQKWPALHNHSICTPTSTCIPLAGFVYMTTTICHSPCDSQAGSERGLSPSNSGEISPRSGPKRSRSIRARAPLAWGRAGPRCARTEKQSQCLHRPKGLAGISLRRSVLGKWGQSPSTTQSDPPAGDGAGHDSGRRQSLTPLPDGREPVGGRIYPASPRTGRLTGGISTASHNHSCGYQSQGGSCS